LKSKRKIRRKFALRMPSNKRRRRRSVKKMIRKRKKSKQSAMRSRGKKMIAKKGY